VFLKSSSSNLTTAVSSFFSPSSAVSFPPLPPLPPLGSFLGSSPDDFGTIISPHSF